MKSKLDESRPIYLQIKEYIEDSILNDTLKSGDRVPSTNEFAKFYNINPATARQGVNELVDELIIRKQRGVGMFVTENAKSILIESRQAGFKKDFIMPLIKEAEKLDISLNKLIELIKESDINED